MTDETEALGPHPGLETGPRAMGVGKSMQHRTMAMAALEELRERILNADYPPGFQLRQEALAREFGMSRIPLREAFLMLEKEGLIRMSPHRGAVVAELTFDEIDELFSMRSLMEPWLMARSIGKLTAGDFAALEHVQEQYALSLAQPLDSHDVARWSGLNRDFHMRLHRHAASPRTMVLVANLLTECDLHTRIQLLGVPGARERAVAEHRALLDLCRSGRHAEAAEAMRAHIDNIRQGLLTMSLRRKREDLSPEQEGA
ncbi:GntR family transcriptional regulator [Neomegalonema sp.]|uniref:GntR family transcriptional regulator n=1 Tax=Neomegalonema sp. TaxID=2039713 RepID=UPI0026018741|nr:GntR family transcriptional regulator [Neomegalonema sp.]MDD2869353.1 GntR family transcriptional regulator [Neomegalonema sp.]